MSAALIALALFGCSDDGTACERLPVAVQTYPSQSECNARLDDALGTEAALKAEAATVYAQCLTTRQLAALGNGTVDLTRFNQVGFAAR